MKHNKLTQDTYFKSVRLMAWSFIVMFCMGVFSPTVSIAGGGGPTQPEVQGFTPVGVSGMVDPFTGDFSYNIPLMDVEGYPINIAYSSGVSMDQEASWVGLGWNLNMGSVVRSMRGLPDDFNGDVVTKELNQKPQTSLTLSRNKSVEFGGYSTLLEEDNNAFTWSRGISITTSNYTGVNAQINFGPSFRSRAMSGLRTNFGINFTGSSENGAGFSANTGLSAREYTHSADEKILGYSVGSSFNSRAGLQSISYKRTQEIGIYSVERELGLGISGAYNFGLHHYSPTVGPSYITYNLSGNFTNSYSFFALDVQRITGFLINVQKLDKSILENEAYGYFNLHYGQKNKNALLDFNRHNDGTFTKYTPNLPSAALMSDLFNVQAQGVGGSYRAFRNEVGYVFDPTSVSKSYSGSLGIETGSGNLLDFGADLSYNQTYAESGNWDDVKTNQAESKMRFESANGLLEEFAFQEANERAVDTDPMFTNQFNGEQLNYLRVEGSSIFPHLEDKVQIGEDWVDLTENSRTERIKRNELLSFLSIEDVQDGMGLNEYRSDIYSGAKAHHIGEMTQLGTDGRRYVFGIPAYNHSQEDVTFAIGSTEPDILHYNGFSPSNTYVGLVGLNQDFDDKASPSNDKGIDNYYSSEKTPAYAHAFLLSAVLSDDYSDSDLEKGPSKNDLGSYVKFDYTKVDNFEWRTPVPENSAYYNEGMKTDIQDDKASFVHGKKDLWYVKAVETKNYIAVFTLEDRKDGLSAKGRQGGLNPDGSRMKVLKKISLYAKPANYEDVSDLTGLTPIQEVHFVYDYSLCQGYPGHISGGGKLTLKEIYFTYQGSYKMKRSSYKFEYGFNPNYGMKNVDRWGTYQPQTANSESGTAMTSGDFPYTIQDEEAAGDNAAAWLLSDIHLPSGGKIHVEYESDDYAYVQHLQASQMYPICGVELAAETTMDQSCLNGSDDAKDISTDSKKNRAIYFKMKEDHGDVNEYAKVGQPLYFRVLTNLSNNSNGNKYEYVSGYGIIQDLDVETISGIKYGRIQLKSVGLKDVGADGYSPITKSAILFGRMHLPRTIYDENSALTGINENSILAFANETVNAFASLSEMVTGPNVKVYNNGFAQQIKMNKSFIRLLEPTGHKFGGGSRVHSIKMYDNWDYMVEHDPEAETNPYGFSYGQIFNYELEDGRSSGVASYEPLLGGDENSWRSPNFYDNKFRFAPDENLYLEDPVMESQFPNPNVGYSRVVITDIKPGEDEPDGEAEDTYITKTATGKVVKEFYTAKDFPTIVKKTSVDQKVASSFLPLLPQYDYLTASQGFAIELNDMHGKPKAEMVYGEGQDQPLSTVHFEYQSHPTTYRGVPCFELDNSVTTIKNDGTLQTATLGVKTEAVADFRQNETSSIGGAIELNFNSFALAPLVISFPSIWPSVDISESRFRSATLNKTVNKFGIQSRVTANQDGSVVETNNLAYDAETGDVLATQTTTNFNDKIYSVSYPAHWRYDQMGMAYQNIGYELNGYPAGADGFVPVPPTANYFVEGDELKVLVSGSTDPIRGWVVEVNSSGIRLIDEDGDPISGSQVNMTIIRSGRRNKQSVAMSSVTSRDNPLSAISTGVFTNVLNAGAIDFKQDWATFCNCFGGEIETNRATTNPYVRGTKGNWRPAKSLTYLTERTQTNSNDNTNIRFDGVFAGFTPYHRYFNGKWSTFGSHWTYVSEVTAFSPSGSVLETKDALGRYSSSLFSYKNTLTTAIAANARKKQVLEASFEDLNFRNCMDESIFTGISSGELSTSEFHTGRNSLHVGSNQTKEFNAVVPECEYEPNCDLSIVASGSHVYKILGADPGSLGLYYTAITGDVGASIDPLTGELTLTGSTDGYFQIEVTITTRDNECELKVLIASTPPEFEEWTMEILSLTEQ